LCINTSLFIGPIAKAMNGTDLSIPVGFLVGAGVYWLLGRNTVSAESPGPGIEATQAPPTA
jgi:nucleobase:cation symporter-1, NCS1 family